MYLYRSVCIPEPVPKIDNSILVSIRPDSSSTNSHVATYYAAMYECTNGTQLLFGNTEFLYNGSAWIGEMFCAEPVPRRDNSIFDSIRFDPNSTHSYAAMYECTNGTQLLFGNTEFLYNGSAWIGEMFCAENPPTKESAELVKLFSSDGDTLHAKYQCIFGSHLQNGSLGILSYSALEWTGDFVCQETSDYIARRFYVPVLKDLVSAKFCIVNTASHNISTAVSRTNNSVTQYIIVLTVEASGTYCTDLVDDDIRDSSLDGSQFGFVLESDSGVTVYLHYDNLTAAPIIPANQLGTEYITIKKPNRKHYVVITALEDNTVIRIRSNSSDDTGSQGTSETLTLNENDSIIREFTSVAKINANTKISVICYELGEAGFISSVPSQSRYGTEYRIPAFSPVRITVTSMYAYTAIKIDESIVVIPEVGGQYELLRSNSICFLKGTEPFMVTMEYLDMSSSNLLLVPPSEQSVSSAMFLQSTDTNPGTLKVALLGTEDHDDGTLVKMEDQSELEFSITEWSDNQTLNSVLLQFSGGSSDMLKFVYFDDGYYIPLPGGLQSLHENTRYEFIKLYCHQTCCNLKHGRPIEPPRRITSGRARLGENTNTGNTTRSGAAPS
ncbi:hypothetical protein ScPMuIL_016754 [Solemya velum]